MTGLTPNRKSLVRFNRFGARMIQGYLCSDKSSDGDTDALGDASRSDNVMLVPGIGWSLKGNGFAKGAHWEYDATVTSTNPGALAEVAGQVADGFISRYSARSETLSGVSYPAGAPSERGPVYRKQVRAGTTWAKRLADDEAAYPGPWQASFDLLPTATQEFLGSPFVPMDRVFVSDAEFDAHDAISLHLEIPGGDFHHGPIAAIYLPGPASADSTFTGVGQLCVVIQQSGNLDIYERGRGPADAEDRWVFRKTISEFNIAGFGGEKVGRTMYMIMRSNAVDLEDGTSIANKLRLYSYIVPRGYKSSQFNPILETLNAIAGAILTTFYGTYRIQSKRPAPIHPCRLRVDMRRDIRGGFKVLKEKYVAEGVLRSRTLALKFAPSGLPNFYLETYCSRPSGTTVTDVKLVFITNDAGTPIVEITGTQTLSDSRGLVHRFELPEDELMSRFCYVQWTLTGPHDKTPLITRAKLRRDPAFETPAADEWVFPYRADEDPDLVSPPDHALPSRIVANVSLTGQSVVPGSDSLSVDLVDLLGQSTQTKTRTGTPIDVEVVNPADGTLISRVFRGQIEAVDTMKVSRGRQYPTETSWRGNVAAKGEWGRYENRLAPHRMTLYNDDEMRPMTISEALIELFVAMGVPYEELDIPEFGIPLLGIDDAPIQIEPDTRLLPIAFDLVENYIGGLLLRDENAGPNGMIRVKMRPQPPYNIVARFTRSAPSIANRLRHIIGAYGTHTREDGHVIPILPIFRVESDRTDKPEGNAVLAIGGAAWAGDAGTVASTLDSAQPNGLMTQLLVNVKSFNFANVAPGHAAYPDPANPDALMEMVQIVVRDTTINSADQLNWVARRVYDASCFAKRTLTFVGHLALIWDPLDDKQTLARPFMAGDAVEVENPDTLEWETWIVAQADPNWTKARAQKCRYVLVRTSQIEKFGDAKAVNNLRAMYLRSQRSAKGVGGLHHFGDWNSPNRAYSKIQSEMAELPEITLQPIQDLDPNSPTYGEFFPMAGMDSAP